MCSMMVVVALAPRLPLLVALQAARRPIDAPVALGPAPGEPQLVGLCTPAAEAEGVRPGLRVSEALARCPRLDLVAPDPGAAAEALERMLARLEEAGFAVEPIEDGAAFDARGTLRLHGGPQGVLRRARAALPVGADGRLGAAPSLFAALQAAREAPSGRPLTVGERELAAFLAPLPIARLPLAPELVEQLLDLGLRRVGQLAALPREAVLERLGFTGLAAWRLARGGPDRPLRPRTPPRPLRVQLAFPEPAAALAALQTGARLLLEELAGAARARGAALRTLGLRAELADGGSWRREVVLREATADPRRLELAALPRLAEVAGPVSELTIVADASGAEGGHQLTAISSPARERRARAREAARQVRAAKGEGALLRIVELEPGSRLPERRWALAPDEP
jgi:nucleotidyltransferase/DNA polymerase involved in DNA repair